MPQEPFDLALYMQLMSRILPQTVFEVGTRFGGSALWFADMMAAHGVDGNVVSVDIRPPQDFRPDPRIRLIEGDAKALDRVLVGDLLKAPKPWLVVEDGSHRFDDSLAVLRFFDSHLATDDYIVIEDGVVAFLPEEIYGRFESGPTRAVEAFLADNGDKYAIDTALCDHYGMNVTYNPNGWLRRL